MSERRFYLKIAQEKIKDLKFGDKVFVKIGKRKIEYGFIWEIRKTFVLIALKDGYYVEVKPEERKLNWKKPNEKWDWEER